MGEAARPPALGVAPAPKPDDRITVVGYPLGGELTLSSETVIDRTDGGNFGVEGTIARITANVQPGNSGGPVLNAKGFVAIRAPPTAAGGYE